MTIQTISKLDALHTAWNIARTAYYKEPTAPNEQRMDDTLRAYLTARGGAIIVKEQSIKKVPIQLVSDCCKSAYDSYRGFCTCEKCRKLCWPVKGEK